MPHFTRLSKRVLIMALPPLAITLMAGWPPSAKRGAAAQSGPGPVAIVSAASYTGALAPHAIAAAFGQNLATRTDAAKELPLPTTLAGTMVKVGGRESGLFFVSQEQVNFMIPPETPIGEAAVEVFVNNQLVARSVARVNQIAPAIFTANNNGRGAPAAIALRASTGASEPVFRCDPRPCVPKPIDLGPEEEKVTLVLFLCGIRGAGGQADQNNVRSFVRVLLGGIEYTPDYAGPAPGFAGLDQINLPLPRALIGRGRVELVVSGANGVTSNETEIEIAPPPNIAAPTVTGVSPETVLAGDEIEISGSGLAPNPMVLIGEVVAPGATGGDTKLTVRTPFGVGAGRVRVRTAQGEGSSANDLKVRTSISGVVVDTSPQPQPLRGATVTTTLDGKTITRTTGDRGEFILPDVPTLPDGHERSADVYIDGRTISAALNYPRIGIKVRVRPNRDNKVETLIFLQQVTGQGANPQPPNFSPTVAATQRAAPQARAQTPIILRDGGVTFEIPAGATITFPPNTPPGPINLTVVGQSPEEGRRQSRVPAKLPPGIFSPRIVQITPFGVKLSPGGKLTFPNPDSLPAGSPATLYRFEQKPGSDLLGQFVEAGSAPVSSDGQQIETAANAVEETSYHFIAAPQTTTAVIGRVVEDSNPVQLAIVQARGQADFTDGNGGFTPRAVPVKPGDSLQVTASYQRSNGRVDYADKLVPAAPNGITNAREVPLPSGNRNRPPVLLVPAHITLRTGETREIPFTAFDPDAGQTYVIQRSLIPQSPNANPAPNFASVTLRDNGEHTLRLTPAMSDAGEYALEISVVDNATPPASITKFIATSVQVGEPVLPGAFTLSHTVSCDTAAPSGPAVRLNWAAASFAVNYDVYRNEALIAAGVTDTSYTDKIGVMTGTSYSYRVTARNAAGARDSNSITANIPGAVCAATRVTVSLPQASGAAGGVVTIPVAVGDLSGRGVIAYEFDLAFDPAVLQFQDPDRNGALSEVMEVTHNATPGRLRVAAYAANPLMGTNRTLLRLRFKVVGTLGATTTLVWRRFALNEGDPIVTATNGGFTVN